jgi:hypothetical protein
MVQAMGLRYVEQSERRSVWLRFAHFWEVGGANPIILMN